MSSKPILASAAALLLSTFGVRSSHAQEVPIVFTNTTGMSSSQVFIQFLAGGGSNGLFSPISGYYYDNSGQKVALESNTSYSLDQLTFNGAAKIYASDFSGRIYMNYGPYGLQNLGASGGGYTPAAADPNDPNYLTRYQYFEQTIVPQSDNSTTIYADLSYIDFTAISLSMYARQSGGAINTNVLNGNQTTANTHALVNATLGSAANAAAAVMPSGASGTLPNPQFARVISPQFSSSGTFHDFTNYLTALGSAGKGVTIAGTFVGTGPQPTGSANTQAQTYDFTGNFSASPIQFATGTGQMVFANGGIVLNATSLSGKGHNGGAGIGSDAKIYISKDDLNSQNGIYGNNVPYYVQLGSGNATYNPAITNDVWGRAVGDLLAGLSFGYVGSDVAFMANGTATTIGALSSSQWWANGQSGGDAVMPDGSTVQWLDTPAGQGIWFASAQPNNADFYNGYAASLVPLTPAYGFPLQDRLGNNLLVYNTGAPLTQNTYLEIQVNPDAANPLATGIWTGGAGSWGDASKWQGNAVPLDIATVQFVGTGTSGITVDTGSNRSAAGIYFNYSAPAFTIENNTITLSGDIVNSSARKQTINSNLLLASNSTSTAAFGDLDFGGTITLGSSGTPAVLTISGNKDTSIAGNILDGLTAGGAIVKTGTGTLTLSGSNSFTGGLSHRSGVLRLASSSAAGTGTLTLGNATLEAIGGDRTLSNALILTGSSSIAGTNAFTFSGPVSLQGTGTGSVVTVANLVPVEFSGVIASGTAGSGFTKTGAGTMTFSGSSANTFTGPLAVNDGVLQLNKSSGAAYGGSLAIGDGTGTAGSAVVRLLAGNQTIASNILVNTDGALDLGSFNTSVGNMTFAGGSVTGTGGTLTISSGSSVLFIGTGNASATLAAGVQIGTGTGVTTFAIGKNDALRQMIIDGPLSGSGSITKSGSGVLSLTSDSTFSGTIAVTGGILESRNGTGSQVTINNGALSPGGQSNIASIELGMLQTGTSGALLMDLGPGSTSDKVTVNTSGGITLGESTLFLFSSAGLATGTGSATVTLVSGSWSTAPTLASLRFASLDIPGLTGTFSYSNNDLIFSANYGVTATWSGAVDGTWTTGGNWVGGAVPASGADLVFTGSASTNVSTVSDQVTGAITFEVSAAAFTIGSNTITLGGKLTNNSANTQTFNSPIVLNASRTVAAASGNIVLNSGIALSSVAALPSTLTFTGTGTTTVQGNIADGPALGGSLFRSGPGMLELLGNNTFTGSLTIAGGTVAALSSAALGNGVTSDTNTLILDGGTLRALGDINSSASAAQPVQRIVELRSGGGTFDSNGRTITLGEITGAGGLTKTGGGTLSLWQGANSNSYLGPTVIQSGDLVMNSAGNLGAGTAGTTVMSGGSLVLNGNMTVQGESLNLAGTGSSPGRGALLVAAGQASWNGSVSLTADASIVAAGTSGPTLALGGSSVNVGTSTLILSTSSGASITLGSTLSGSGGITKSGDGTLNIIGSSFSPNTAYTGTTTVAGGILNLQSSTSLGSAASALVVQSGATFSITGQSSQPFAFSTIAVEGTGVVVGSGSLGAISNNVPGKATLAGSVTLSGDALIYSGSGALTLSGSIDTNGHLLSVQTRASETALTGAISGGGGLTMMPNSTSGLFLSGNNTYTGPTTINNGSYITAASSNALGLAAGTTTVLSGGSLNLQGGTAGITIAEPLSLAGTGFNGTGALRNLSGNNAVSGSISLTNTTTISSGNGTLNITSDFTNNQGLTLQTDTATAGITFSGAFSGNNTTTVQGKGVVTISGDTSSYAQTIFVNSGTLVMGTGSSAATVNLNGNPSTPSGGVAYSPGGLNQITNAGITNLISTNGTLLMDLGPAGTSDTITTTNGPSLNGSVYFFFNDAGYTGSGTATLIQTTVGIGGSSVLTDYSFTTNISGLSGSFLVSTGAPGSVKFQSFAAPGVWNNAAADGQWNDAANWNVGVVPAQGSAVEFTALTPTTVDTQGNRLVGGIAFKAGSAALTISNNTISAYGEIRNDSNATQTIASGLSVAGNLTVNAAAANLALAGQVTLGSGSTLTFSGSQNTTVSGPIVSGGTTGGGALVKNGSGVVTLSGVNTFGGPTSINSGTLAVTGQLVSSVVTVGTGGTLSGSGTVSGPIVVHGTLSPGNSPGTLATGSKVWSNGADYNWQLYDATGAAGTGYDTISVSGTLNLTSLAAGGFSINLWSLSGVGPDANGDALNFDQSANYSWTLVSTSGGLMGFDAADFKVEHLANNGTAGFSNAFSGTFGVQQSGNDLVLSYTAIPEPSTSALLAAAAGLFARRRRRISRWPFQRVTSR